MAKVVISIRTMTAVAALSLGACATVDEPLLEASLPTAPDRWTADPELTEETVDDWTVAFQDEQLTAIIKEALDRNNDIRLAAANLEQAQAGARISRADLLPQIQANFAFSRNAIVTNPTTAAQAGGGAASAQSARLFINNYDLTGRLTWEIDVWGRLLDETRASYLDAGAAYADLSGAELSIAARTAQAWYGLIEARLQRELAERDVAALESSLRVTERRYERGVASSLDVRLSRSNLGTSQASLALRQRLEKEAARELEVLLGRYPAAEIEAAAALPRLEELSGAGAPGELLARRPDVIASEARLTAAGLRARAARKQLLPQITFSSQAGTSGPDFADLTDPQRLAGNIFSGLTQPLFQGGRLLANKKRAKAAAEAAVFSYVQTVLVAYQEAENAIAAERLLAAQEDALRFAYEEAAASESLTQRRYASGAATIFNLLDAQTRRIGAERQYIEVQRQRVTNRVQLYLAIGGDFLTDYRPSLNLDGPGTPET